MNILVSTYVSYLVPRLKSVFLLCLVFGCSFVVFILLNADPTFYMANYNYRVYIDRQYSEDQPDNSSTIRTKGCRIPLLAGDDDSIRKMAKNVTSLRPCKPYPLLGSNKTHIWIEKKNMPYYNLSSSSEIICCYRSFYRPTSINDITAPKIDDRVKYNSCHYFTDTVDVNDEFVRVICNDTNKTRFDSFYVFAREKQLKSKPNKDLPYNVLILGIDSVSRLNLHRTMPKTVAYLNELGAVEFLGYNKVGDNTFPNLIPLLLGIKDTELHGTCWPNEKSSFDNCPFIWERYQQAGFATALVEDTSWLGTFNYFKRGFNGFPTDYYLRTFFHEAEHIAGTNKDGNSKLCMNEKFFFKIFLDYIEDLTTTLRSKLFGFFWETTISHDHLNYPVVMDDSYHDLFRKMDTSGYLNETIVFLMSDHGMRWGKFRSTKQGYLEERLPFVMAVIPSSFRSNFKEAYNNLKLNSRRLTTPFDMHATLSDLINLDSIKNAKIFSRSYENYSNNRGISLFLPVPGNRTCKSAAIDAHWCTCYRNVRIRSNSLAAKKSIEHIVSHLNSILKNYPECAELRLAEVLEVTRLLPSSPEESTKKSFELTVVVRTNPGGGVFEATAVRLGGRGGNWSLAGSVSRLNLYGNQSYCAPTSQLKLYCYCINSTLSTMETASS